MFTSWFKVGTPKGLASPPPEAGLSPFWSFPRHKVNPVNPRPRLPSPCPQPRAADPGRQPGRGQPARRGPGGGGAHGAAGGHRGVADGHPEAAGPPALAAGWPAPPPCSAAASVLSPMSSMSKWRHGLPLGFCWLLNRCCWGISLGGAPFDKSVLVETCAAVCAAVSPQAVQVGADPS